METLIDPAFRIQFIRVLMSILELYNTILIGKDIKLNSITDKRTGEENLDNIVNIPRCIESLGIDVKEFRKLLQSENASASPHFSSASGPNGSAMWESHIDAIALFEDKELFSNFQRMGILSGRPELAMDIEGLIAQPRFFKLNMGKPIHSKLHFILEKGDKVRTVAILDWWTQEMLNPLHKVLATFLRKMETDGTFDQDRIANKVKALTASRQIDVISLDLTAATDRLPVELQARILSELTGMKQYGSTWADLLTGRDFVLPNGTSVRYATGQPMGAKSSFTMLALTHHLIVMEAANRALVSDFRNYVILGDDIVIGDLSVAQKYKEIMLELGMEVSMNKTIWLERASRLHNVAEICKRLFVDGVEVLPLPVRLLANAVENGQMLYQLQEEMAKRELVTRPSDFKYFVAAIAQNKSHLELLSLLNILPSVMTGMKSRFMITANSVITDTKWSKLLSLELSDLMQVFIYTVCIEQLKRLGVMVKQSSSPFEIMKQAGKLFNATGIGYSIDPDFSGQLEYKPFINFTEDDMSDWALTGMNHPAYEIIKHDVHRINMMLVQLSVATSDGLIAMLMDSIVDTLKMSLMDTNDDKRLAESNMTRRLLEMTSKNIDTINLRENKTLSFSIKLMPFNILWNLKFTIGSRCQIYRSASSISTTMRDAIKRYDTMVK
jgi:hypothetical protein